MKQTMEGMDSSAKMTNYDLIDLAEEINAGKEIYVPASIAYEIMERSNLVRFEVRLGDNVSDGMIYLSPYHK